MLSVVVAGGLLGLATVLVVALSSWWLWFTFSHFSKLLKRVPGPNPKPLIGSALALTGECDNVLEVFHKRWPNEYGDIYRVFVGTKAYVVVSSCELAELVVKSPTMLDKGDDYQILVPWLGDGLLISSQGKWKSRRRLLTPAFHFHILEEFFETFNVASSVLCRKLRHLCGAQAGADVEVSRLLNLCTLDVICETAMGCQINAQIAESDYVQAVESISEVMTKKFFQPWLNYDIIFDRTSLGRTYHHGLQVLHDFTDRVIKERRDKLVAASPSRSDPSDGGAKSRRPFLDVLLEASASGTVLTDKDIREEVDTFMFEGHDTTAQAMSWFLYCMALNPEHQERVWLELSSVFGHSDRPCTRQDLPDLKYLECCIKESLRLHPSVPAFSRVTSEDTQLGPYRIPAGLDLVVSIYALHRNPRIYNDPLTFDPERFFPEQANGRHPFAYIPFSAGPRNCIGQRFAMAEEKVILSSLLRQFKFELAPTAQKPVPSLELTLKPTNGVTLRVSPR